MKSRYPNYKFNPKKKVTKKRAYKKRSDDAYSLQDIEQKRRLHTLYNQGHIQSELTITKVDEPATKEDICCANCYASSKTCFSRPSFTHKRNSTESVSSTTSTTTSYTTLYDYAPTNSSYRTSRCYNASETQLYSAFRVPAIIHPAEEYYSGPTGSTTTGVPFPSLIHASYSPPISPSFHYRR